MARDTSPIVKQSRREGYALAPKAHKVMAKKSGIPGEHADMRVRGGSLYLTQLREKQKVRRLYGLLEKQFAKLMKEAAKTDGLTGENLLRICESRLDNVVYRLGFAASRKEARQLVRHNHFTVNGKKANIPSILLKSGDLVAVASKSGKLKEVVEAMSARPVVKWLDCDKTKMTGRVIELPHREDIDLDVEEHLIVELYSK